MKSLFRQISLILIVLFSLNSFATSLAEDAQNRGINETCSNYLEQIESSYGLSGLNITFAHPEKPSLLPSLDLFNEIKKIGSICSMVLP